MDGIKTIIALVLFLFSTSLTQANQPKPVKKKSHETILTLSRTSTKKYVLPGATVVSFSNSRNLEGAERETELEKHRASVLSKPAVAATMSRLPSVPGSRRENFKTCVRLAIDERTTLTLEALAQLCAVAKFSDPMSVGFVSDVINNQTLVILIKDYDEQIFEGLVSGGMASATTQNLPPPACGYGQVCNPCRAIDKLGLGLVEMKLTSARRDVWYKLARSTKLYSELEPYQKQIVHKSEGREVAAYQLASVVGSDMIQKYRDEYIQVGSSFDPATVTVLFDTALMHREDWVANGIGIACAECPSGSISNGVDDCISRTTGCSVLNGCKDEPGCQNNRFGFVDDCPNSCETYCQAIGSRLETLERERLPDYKASDPKRQQIIGIISEYKKRHDQESSTCRRNPKAQVCDPSQFSYILSLYSPDVMARPEERNCVAPKILVPTPGKGVIKDRYSLNEFKECADINCRWGMNNIRYFGESRVGNCPYFAVSEAVKAIRQQRWLSHKGPLCKEEIISEGDIRKYFRDTGFNCEAYAALASPPMYSPATPE